MRQSEDFWTFSLRVYAKADVAPACLALQNQYGLDVNLLLYGCWLGARGVQLDVASLTPAMAFSGRWSEHVVRPLRRARTWMKNDSDARGQLPADIYDELRESIKTIELEAERLQQLALEAMTVDSEQTPTRADEAATHMGKNLALYASEAGITLDTDARKHLGIIIGACADIDAARAIQHLPADSRSGTPSTHG